jgi:hypothetical protein
MLVVFRNVVDPKPAPYAGISATRGTSMAHTQPQAAS